MEARPTNKVRDFTDKCEGNWELGIGQFSPTIPLSPSSVRKFLLILAL